MSNARFGTAEFYGESLVRNVAWQLDRTRLRNGQIYKTHDLPCRLRPADQLRAVFVFGSASDAVRSILHCDTTHGRQWVREHFEHLGATGRIEDITERDVLRLEEQLHQWTSVQSIPVLALKYEDLWASSAQDVLSRFVGFPVRLPAQKQRESSRLNSTALDERLAATYRTLDQKIAAMPSILPNNRALSLIGSSFVRQKAE